MWNKKIEDCILYEDHEILVCHKPAGIAVQNSRIESMDMESALRNYLAAKSGEISTPWLGVVHRLDQPVEGAIIFAKTAHAAAKLNSQMTKGDFGKIYLAVTGQCCTEEGILIDYLLKDGRKNMSSVVNEKTKGSKKAILGYQLLEKIQDERISSGIRCLIKIKLDTGRHHQIRVQMCHAGMPLIGDRKYNPTDVSGLPLGLCSSYLSFVHPVTGKKMEFSVFPKGDTFKGFSGI